MQINLSTGLNRLSDIEIRIIWVILILISFRCSDYEFTKRKGKKFFKEVIFKSGDEIFSKRYKIGTKRQQLATTIWAILKFFIIEFFVAKRIHQSPLTVIPSCYIKYRSGKKLFAHITNLNLQLTFFYDINRCNTIFQNNFSLFPPFAIQNWIPSRYRWSQ